MTAFFEYAMIKLVKKVLLIFFWLPVAFLLLITSLVLFFFFINQEAEKQAVLTLSKEGFLTKSLILGAYDSHIIAADARSQILKRFLANYKSPLEPYAQLLVETADRYNLDFRLLPAIAMQESNLCAKIPENSYNCWGFGIYADKVIRFDSYERAVETVAKTLSENYSRNGLLEPEEIMRKYTPQSKGSWAYAVLHFMEQMR